jgi:hypothetical protein
MFEWLVYIGGLADVEVPLDEPYGGYVIADRRQGGEVPEGRRGVAAAARRGQRRGEPGAQAAVAEGHAKEIAAAEKTGADPTNETAEPGAPAEEGEQS